MPEDMAFVGSAVQDCSFFVRGTATSSRNEAVLVAGPLARSFVATLQFSLLDHSSDDDSSDEYTH